MISSSAGTYTINNVTIGATSTNTSRTTSFVNTNIGQGAATNPAIFTVMSDGTRVFGNAGLPSQTNNYIASGSLGTPLV
jgi:hypothetical protein